MNVKIVIVLMGLLIGYRLYRLWKEKNESRVKPDENYYREDLLGDKYIPVEERNQPRRTEKMEQEKFWTIIDHSRRGTRNIEEQCKALNRELRTLSIDAIVEFDNKFKELKNQSYTWELWGAVYLLNGGCSDDTFEYFRSWLIGQGKERFLKAIENPESILDFVKADEDWEGLDYCANEIFTEITGKQFIPGQVEFQEEPSGVEWSEDELPRKFPRIWKRVDKNASQQ